MDIVSNVPTVVAQALRASGQFASGTVVAAYDRNINPVPLDDGIIAVSQDNATIGPHNTTVNSDGEIVETSQRTVVTRLKMTIFVPYSLGAAIGYNLFDKACTYLLASTGAFEFSDAQCGGAEYRKENEALVIESYIKATRILTL